MELSFTNPQYLWILLVIPFLAITHIFALKKKREAALKFANFDALERISKGDFLGKPYFGLFRSKNISLLLLRMLTYCIFILSIAGITVWYTAEVSDFDYVLTIDASASMLADDYQPNRLGAAKSAALLFLDSLPSKTSIGLVSFSGSAFIDQRLTDDLVQAREKINSLDIIVMGGTAIGEAIITSSNLFEEEKSNVIILLTDGQTNIGADPIVAADYALENNIMINTIGVGTEEGGSFIGINATSQLDEETLKNIAKKTGGKYYRAENNEVLQGVFRDMASSQERKVSFDLSPWLLFVGIFLLSLEWVLLNTKYRTIP